VGLVKLVGHRNIKVALVNPPLLPGIFRHHLVVPLGLAYLAAVLERARYEVRVFDCPPLGVNHGELGKMLADFCPDLVGVTCTTVTVPSALRVASVSKKYCSQALVVTGGPHVTFTDIEVLKNCPNVDVVVRREGERTFLKLVRCIAKGEKFYGVDGISFRKDGKIIRTSDSTLVQDLDRLPYPAYHLFPMDKYRIFGKKIMPIMTSRGCPFQCSFCVTSRMVGKRFRVRSPESVVDELEWLKNVHEADAFCFYDDTLTFDKKRIAEICDMIKRKKIGVPWDCQTRTDQVSKEILSGMADAGCQLVSFGVESGSQNILSRMGKGTTVEQNRKAIVWAKEAGLLVAISLIVGYPGETAETLKETLDFIWRMKPDDAYLCFAAPYPGTELRGMVSDLGWNMSQDWTHYDTLTPAFENPNLSNEYMEQVRRDFYNKLYSPLYVLRHFFKNNLYSRIMARTALNHIIWRMKR